MSQIDAPRTEHCAGCGGWVAHGAFDEGHECFGLPRAAAPQPRDDLRAALDQLAEPRCQFIKANETTAKGHGQWGGGHPWPMTPDVAEGYHLLCGGRRRDHPARFVGPEWNHDEFVYDPAYDSAPIPKNRVLAALRAQPSATPTSHPDDGHEHSWGCRRCGVDPLPAPADSLDVERLARAIREALHDAGWSLTLSIGTSWQAVAARIAAKYGAEGSSKPPEPWVHGRCGQAFASEDDLADHEPQCVAGSSKPEAEKS